MHHSSHWAATFHLRLSWFNILISPVWCHKVDVCVCVPESAYYGQRWKEKMRNWEAGDEEMTEHRENNLIVELDGCSSSFLFFICFLFPLLIFLPPKPPSISPNSLMASISEGVFACAHMHLRCFQMWFIRSEQQLVLMCGGLLMIGFFLTQAGDWCWWWPPCCFHSSLNQKSESQKHTYIMDCVPWKKLKNTNYTSGTSLSLMFNHKSIIVVVFGFKISVLALVAGSSGGPSCPEVKKLNVSEFLL